jgi:hypothetical protein
VATNSEIFISHDHSDETLALLLKDLLEDTFLNISVFVSGRDLTGGDIWISEIRQRLANSNVLLALITQFSESNPWVMFEAGAGFMNSRCIPVCADEVSVRRLRPPLSLLHARAFTEDGLQKLTKDIAKHLSIRTPKALPTLSSLISKAKEFTTARSKDIGDLAKDTPPKPGANVQKTFDKGYLKKVATLTEDLRRHIIAKIVGVADRYDVPSKPELNKMNLSNLSEVASAFSIPIPGTAVAQLLLLQVTPLEADAPKWRKMNFDKRLRSIEINIKTLSQFGV